MFIEEQREKTKFEGSLPPTSDEACFILRRKLMEGQEIREWQKREKNIKKLQKNKLNLLQTLLEERERLAEKENQARVAKLKQKKTEAKNLLKVKIDQKKVKILRKMETLRRGFARLGRKRGLVEEYRDFASKIYANMTREGLCPTSLGKEFNFDFAGFQKLSDFNAFVEKLNKGDLEFDLQLEEILRLQSKKMTKMERQHRWADQAGAAKGAGEPSADKRPASQLARGALRKHEDDQRGCAAGNRGLRQNGQLPQFQRRGQAGAQEARALERAAQGGGAFPADPARQGHPGGR